jgi:hypothetical protein
MIKFQFEDYMISFPRDITYNIFDDIYCYGIRIYDGNDKYELIHNRQANWSRIFIIKNNVIKDIPFKDSTMDLLPDYVKIQLINPEK